MKKAEPTQKIRVFTGGKRAKMVDCVVIGSFAFSDEGSTYHIASGIEFGPPIDDNRVPMMEINDDRAYLTFLMENTPRDVLSQMDEVEWGRRPPPFLLRDFLAAARLYPGDPVKGARKKTDVEVKPEEPPQRKRRKAG